MSVACTHHATHASVHFAGGLDWESAAELVDVVETLTTHYFYGVVELTVTSNGGATEAFEHVLGAMRRWEAAGVRVVTRAVGSASSAGALLVSLGTERVAAPRAQLRYHHVMAPEPGALTAAGARELERTLTATDVLMVRRLVERALQTEACARGEAPAEDSDREVLAHLVGRRRSASRRRAGRFGPRTRPQAHSAACDVQRLAHVLARRVERAVRRRDVTALGRLYVRLAARDVPISASLARTLRLIDRIDAESYRPSGAVPAPGASLTVPQWRALYPPSGEVPLAALTRHVLVLGETGTGKSASAILPVLAAAARAPLDSVGCGLVVDPKRELKPALKAIAPQRLRSIVASETVLNVMGGERWSIDNDVCAGRCLSAAAAVLRRVVSFVPDIPAQVLENRASSHDPYWALEGTELLLTVLAVVLVLLRPGAPEPEAYSAHPEALRWLRAFHARARGETGRQRGPNLIALASWALRGPLMRMCAARPSEEEGRVSVVYLAEGEEDTSGGWCCAHVARALLDHGAALSGEAREALERAIAYWSRLAQVRNTFSGVLGSAVASTGAFAAPSVATTLYFGVEPGFHAAAHERESIDFARAVSREGEGHLYVFQPARDQLDNLIAMALKATYFEAVLADPDRARGRADMPLAFYVADEFQRYVTSDRVHGEQSFFDTCRSFRATCVVAYQSVASLEHALSHGGGGERRDDAAVNMLWTNTASKMVFRTTDGATATRLESLCPERRGLVDVVRARPPSTVAVGECYAALADGRFERRQLEPLVLGPERDDTPRRTARPSKARRRRRLRLASRRTRPRRPAVQEEGGA